MKQKFFGIAVFLAMTAANTTTSAQNPIKGAATDEKYANTTVVYKDSNATDLDVLSQLDNSVGMGDVVRITVAPPKPAPTPAVTLKSASISTTAVKSTASTVAVTAKPAAVAPAPEKISKIKTDGSTGKSVASTIPVAKNAAKPVVSTPVVPQSVVPRAQTQNPTNLTASTDNALIFVNTGQAQYANIELPNLDLSTNNVKVNTVETKAGVEKVEGITKVERVKKVEGHKAAKVVKKSGKKSAGWTLFAPKMKKHGKQRYGCYKF